MAQRPNVTIKPVHTFLLGYCVVDYSVTDYDGQNIPEPMRLSLHTSNEIQRFIDQCDDRLTSMLSSDNGSHNFSYVQFGIRGDEVNYLVYLHLYDDTLATAFRLMFDGDKIFSNY